jgi:alpha-D-ribose 1-methylphosphonate 5-phosphate C-P lyase
MPEFMQTVYKTTNSIPRAYRRQFLLKPGTIVANEQCKFDYTGNLELFGQGALVNTGSFTPYSSDLTSFDIRDNYFTTNLRDGIVHLVFAFTDYDVDGINWFQITFVLKNILKLF